MKNHNGSADRNNSTVPLQLEHIEAIEKRLWNAADTLRSDSNYASNNEKKSLTATTSGSATSTAI